MNEKTRKIFDAPWATVEEPGKDGSFGVVDDSNCPVAHRCYILDAKRIALLPVLYENLVEAAYEFCHNCLSLTGKTEYVPDSDEFIEKGCPKKSKKCFVRTWWNTLKQVRGEKCGKQS